MKRVYFFVLALFFLTSICQGHEYEVGMKILDTDGHYISRQMKLYQFTENGNWELYKIGNSKGNRYYGDYNAVIDFTGDNNPNHTFDEVDPDYHYLLVTRFSAMDYYVTVIKYFANDHFIKFQNGVYTRLNNHSCRNSNFMLGNSYLWVVDNIEHVEIWGPSYLNYKEIGDYLSFPIGGGYINDIIIGSQIEYSDYEWYYRLEGFNWSGIVSTTPQYSHMMGKKTTEIKAKISDEISNSKYAIKHVYSGSLPPAIEKSMKKSGKAFALKGNHPNPFNPATNISFDLQEESFVNLVVFDINGREVTTLVNEQLSEGSYNAKFDASNLPSGIYIYKITANSFSQIKRMLLLK